MLWMGLWVHPYAVPLHVQVGVSFRKNGVWPSLNDDVVSLLRLQTPIDCIPHLYWMYTKCFSTLRCCGWAYHGCTLMPYHYMFRWGWVSGKMGYGRACMMLWCHCWGCKPPLTAYHIYVGYTKSFSTLRCCGWAYGCTIMPYHYMFRWGWVSGKMGYGRACMMLRCHGWGCKPPLTASHIYIGCIQSVLALEMLWMGIWVHPYAILHVQVGVSFRENGVWPSLYDVVVSLLRLQTPIDIDCIPHLYWICWHTWFLPMQMVA
jgi:hypothetical protein